MCSVELELARRLDKDKLHGAEARIAELEQKLCDSLDAERASNIRIAEFEAQTPSALKEKLRSAESRIAELEQKLCDSLDAERAANVLISKLERQQAALVGALETIKTNAGHAEFVWRRASAELAAVKPAEQRGGE